MVRRRHTRLSTIVLRVKLWIWVWRTGGKIKIWSLLAHLPCVPIAVLAGRSTGNNYWIFGGWWEKVISWGIAGWRSSMWFIGLKVGSEGKQQIVFYRANGEVEDTSGGRRKRWKSTLSLLGSLTWMPCGFPEGACWSLGLG